MFVDMDVEFERIFYVQETKRLTNFLHLKEDLVVTHSMSVSGLDRVTTKLFQINFVSMSVSQ